MLDVERTALAFDRACSKANVPYAFMGGIAVLAWGQPRATADVDALVAVRPEEVARLVQALAAERLRADPRDFDDARHDGLHVIHDDANGFHVDCKLATTTDEADELRHARDVAYEDGRLRIVGPEDTIAFKLKFGSAQDLQDARSIWVRQEGRLDLTRLRDVARRLGVQKALDELGA